VCVGCITLEGFMADQRGISLIGILLVLALVCFAAWYVIGRTATSGVGVLADAGAPLDETKRQRTLVDMHAIGRANDLMRADTGRYAPTLAALESGGYMEKVPPADGWGTAWIYATGARGFTLTSLGSDGRPGPEAPSPWTAWAYPCDLVMENGQLTQAPTGR
jgi:type II secretory pathway pseudopilin PulG